MTRFLCLMALAALSLATPAAAADNAASNYVETLGNKAIGIIANAKYSKPQKQAALEKIFSDNVDIPWVGRFVMGRFWRQATPEQQKRYVAAYEKFIITYYAARFSEYSGGKFTITGTKQDGDGEYTVSLQMMGDKSDEQVLVDYRVRGSGKAFKIFDVIVEGVSMITTQRSEFSSVLNDKGIDYLIGKLESKTLTPPAQ